MVFGTLFGVIVIPGLYYIFAKMSEGRQIIKDEDNTPLSEGFYDIRKPEIESSDAKTIK